MGCETGIVKVYEQNGLIVIEARGNTSPVNPSLVIPVYTDKPDAYQDRVSIVISGANWINLTNIAPDLIRDENGDLLITEPRVQTVADVRAYFEELGVGQGGGSFDPNNYYPKDVIDEMFAEVYALIGVTPLDTPVGAFSNTTANSTTLTLTPVANATTYEFKRNGSVVQMGPSNILNDTGLSPSTQYSYTWVAKGAGYANSLPGSGSVTTQSGGGGTNTNIFPLIFPFQFAS